MIQKSTLLFTSLLILFSACGENAIESEKKPFEELSKEGKIVQKEDKTAKTTDDLLKNMGFDFNGEKVLIDMNKTSHFFEKIEIEMHGKAQEIERKITNAEINFTKGIGIELTDDKIGIDLNKTRNMLQEINILVKDIVLDINNTIH
jgi:hypothetical protein